MTKKNPDTKLGDKIMLIKSNNNSSNYKKYEGQVGVVTRERQGSNYIHVKMDDTQTICMYYTGPADEFILADRKEQAKWFKEQNKEMTDKIKKNKEEILRLEKFDTEEEFVAYKIDLLMKTKGIKAKAAILRELKTSNYL